MFCAQTRFPNKTFCTSAKPSNGNSLCRNEMGAYASFSRSKGLGEQMTLAHILESILLVFLGLQYIKQDNNLFGPLKTNPKSYDPSWVLDKFTPRIEKGSPNGLLLNLRCHHMETSNSEASAHHKHPSRIPAGSHPSHGGLFLALDEPQAGGTSKQRKSEVYQVHAASEADLPRCAFFPVDPPGCLYCRSLQSGRRNLSLYLRHFAR